MKTSRFGIVVFGVLLAVMVGSVAHGQSQSSCVTGGAVPAGNAGLSQDCEALLDSLDTLPGSSTSLNWSDSRSISQWTGVSLGGSPQRVTSIKLMRQNLDGSIPADIGRVEKLVDLWLYHNSLQGPIPADLGNLADLRTLMLGWNNLSGQIPDTLNNLTLNRLWLRNNDFTGCVPYNLSLVPDNDLDHVPLPICGSSTHPTTPTLGETSETLSEMVRRVRPSVVRVETVDHEGIWSYGSGFIVDTGEEGEAYILTNHHVVEEFQELLVVVEDSIELTPRILVTDPRRDIALLQICCGEFSYVEFTDSDVLYPGDEVIAIGYAAHDVVPRTFRPGRDIVPGEATVTRGIISAFRYDSAMDAEVVQHDAPINGGNSGGPLFSRDGRVVGMNTFNFSESGLEALSFAVLETTVQERLRLWDLGPSESFGLLSGNLDHRTGNLTDFSPDFTANADEFAISAAFANPYAADEHPWDYGFTFGQNLFFMVHSDGIWMVGERLSEDDAFMELHIGLAPQLLLSSGDGNTLELFVDGAYGWLYVNGQKVLDLEGNPYYPYGPGIDLGGGGVSSHGGPVTAFTGLHPDSRRDGYATTFEHFEGTTYDHGADAPPPSDDRAALVALYNATDGPNWTNNTNWLSDAPIGTWHGVTADAGRVVELWLNDNDLTGQIPPELGNLSNLTSLHLGSNEFTGAIPPELGRLSNLIWLGLEDNQLSGAIPPELGRLSNLQQITLDDNKLSGGISPELGNLSNLTSLHLQSNEFTGEIPPELGNLSNLEWLYLDRNQLSGEIPPELGSLSNLEDLSLRDNQLSGAIPPELGGLSNLQQLALDDNLLSGGIPEELDGLSNLTLLFLSHNRLSGELPRWLGGLSDLQDLWLHGNQLTGEIPQELGNLSNLWRLYLRGNQLSGCIPAELRDVENNDLDELGLPDCDEAAVREDSPDRAALVALYNATDGPNWINNTNWLSDEPLGEWHGVTTDSNVRVSELWLNDNGLKGQIPAELGNLANLTFLGLWGNELTGMIPPELGGLSNLTELWLIQNELSGQIPTQLGNLSKLTYLRLEGNELTGEIPPELGSLPKLTNLHLGWNDLTGGIPPEFGGLSDLTWLDLSGTRLSGEIPPELGSLSKLTYLHLGWNEFTGEIPPELGSLTNLTALSLSSNQLSGEIPPELGNLSNLTELYLGWNELTGAIPSELGDLSNLQWLDLGVNELTEEIPPELGGLSNLEGLYLRSNQLSGEIPPELGNLSNLTLLHLGSNEFTGEIPLELGRLSNLNVLYLGNYHRDSHLFWCVPEAVRQLIPSLMSTDIRGLPVCTSMEVFLASGDAPRIYNDNLFVMPVDEILTWEIPFDEHIRRVRRFYEHFNDAFDFLIFVRNTGPSGQLTSFGGFYYGVMNDTEGIGIPISSDHEQYGLESPGVLQGIAPLSGALAISAGPALHEIMHRWANFVVPTVWETHWGFSSAYGQLGGLDIETLVDHGNGLYSADMLNRGSHTVPYSPIELYLAGLIPADEVPDIWVAEDGERAPSDEDLCVNGDGHCMFTATKVRTYTIEDIIAEHGERVPDYLNSQKDFRAAVVLLIDEDHPAIEWQVERVSADIAAFSLPGPDEDDDTYNFWEAMGGRATITMDGLSQFLKDTP